MAVHAAIICQFTTSGWWLGPALGSKVKCHYVIEHNVSIIQLPLKHNSYISRNCWHSIIQEVLGIIAKAYCIDPFLDAFRLFIGGQNRS